jgi:hypothetical protein
MNWNELVSQVLLEKTVQYDDIKAVFDFHDFEYVAYGDVTIEYDGVQDNFNVDVKLFEIHVLNDDGSLGGQVDRPMPEMMRDAQYALQDRANDIASEQGDFDGVRSSRHATFSDPDEPRSRD